MKIKIERRWILAWIFTSDMKLKGSHVYNAFRTSWYSLDQKSKIGLLHQWYIKVITIVLHNQFLVHVQMRLLLLCSAAAVGLSVHSSVAFVHSPCVNHLREASAR